MTLEVPALRRLKPKDPLSPEIQDQPGNIDRVSEDNVNLNRNYDQNEFNGSRKDQCLFINLGRFFFLFLLVLGIEPRTLDMLGKCSTIECHQLHP